MTTDTADAGHLTTIYLARHGQSECNHQRLVTGQLDPALSPQGRQQAEALARCVQGVGLHAIYTSALRRAVDTAAPGAVACGLAATSWAALNEIHMGVLQGRHRDQRDPEAQALWAQWQADPWGYAVPGAERFGELAQRVGTALNTLLQRHAGQQVLVVGHSATNRVLLGLLLAQPRDAWFVHKPRHKYCWRLQLGAGAPRLDSLTLSGRHAGRCEPGLAQ